MALRCLIFVMALFWVFVPYPLGLLLFLLCAGGHWTLKRAQDVLRRHRHPDILEVG